jgi:integrase
VSIRRRGKQAYQVRVAPFPAQTVPTRQAAEKVELDLKLRRSTGELYVERSRTLGEELDSFINRVRASGRGDRTIEFYERSARVWRPFRSKQVGALRRPEVEDFITDRAAAHGRSAKNELELLKRVLGEAKARGQKVDLAVLAIPPIKHQARRGRALTVPELWELAAWFPEHSSRLVLAAGQVGARQNFWFNLTDDMLDLKGGTLTVPAELAKNRREHRIYLTEVETRLLREQLLARATGTSLVFPTRTGRKWTRSGFRQRVWVPAVKLAATSNPRFEGLTFHLLRHTAGSLMASFGVDPASAAERLGHTDGGALFLRTYRHLYEGEKRSQAERFGSRVQAVLDEEWTSAVAELENGLVSGDPEWAHLGLKQPRRHSALRPSEQKSCALQALLRVAKKVAFGPQQLSKASRVVNMWSAGVAHSDNSPLLSHLRCICVSARLPFVEAPTC